MDKFGMNNQTEHMYAKYAGTGNVDISKHAWLTNQHRDTLAYYVADNSLANYISIVEGECVARVKFNCLQKMQQPCGPPPASDTSDNS